MRIFGTLRAAITIGLATITAASSHARPPLRSIALAKNADILTQTHRVTAVSTFDLAFDVSGQRIRLSLEPNHDLFVDGGQITHLNADGSIARQEPIERLQHKVYKGTAWLKRGNRWDNVGWARIGIRKDGLEPLFEGTFTVNHDHHHVKTASSYKSTRQAEDPDVDLRDREYMVVFRDSDMGNFDEHTELRKRGDNIGCPSDDLIFNTQEDHPVYASMRARDESSAMSPSLISAMFKRQSNSDDTQSGGNGAGVDLSTTIGSTAGCPGTRKVALVGVAADCTYVNSFNGDKNRTQTNIIDAMNQASELFESTFNISLGLANVLITEPECPTSQQQATPWNQGCSSQITIQDRLNQFSQWRGQQQDTYSHWTLLSTCNTGSAVGLAWLGQACTTGSQDNSGNSGETVAGANVVIKTGTEWQVIAHETGHTYGAVHDCTSDTCGNSDIVSSQQCCPLSQSTCDANGGFIMNPSTSPGISRFSACSIGNICSALGRNSVKSQCLTNNRDVTLLTGQRCGNGIVEGDEQCDCGGTSGCEGNNCCNPETCRFINNAVCDDSNEDCCRDCQFASANTVCRNSVGECDPEETCTGNSPYCPEDKTKNDGSSCGNGLSCASGQCTSRDMQCKTIMGSYTQSNDTYACDNSNCMLSCASPEFGARCYGLQQNFLDGTSCTGGGKCSNGVCEGGSVGREITSWIDRHLSIVIGVAAGVGGALLLCIFCCCWRSYRRRSKLKKYAAAHPPVPYQGSSRRNRGGPTGPPPMGQYNNGFAPPPGPPPPQGSSGPWAPNPHAPNGNVPMPPPVHRSSVRYTFDIIGELFYGRAFGFLDEGKDQNDWIKSLDKMIPFVCLMGVAPPILRPLIGMGTMLTAAGQDIKNGVKNIGSSSARLMKEAYATRHEVNRTDMAQQVFDIYEKNGEKMDFTWGDVEQESYGALFAGSDTTAIAFRSLFYHLMHSPNVYARLEKEIDEAFQEGHMDLPPTYKQASQLPYLCACIKEALRIHPGAQLSLPRTVPRGGMELCGQFIPEGYTVGINAAVMHFDRRVFGQDADIFNPDRWMDPVRANQMDKYMMSFGGGTRTCIGKNIALIELHKLSPQLVWNYHFEFYDAGQTQWHTRNTFFARQEGMVVRVKVRKHD
ncbi:unnamed protein product [Alternaria alternata]